MYYIGKFSNLRREWHSPSMQLSHRPNVRFLPIQSSQSAYHSLHQSSQNPQPTGSAVNRAKQHCRWLPTFAGRAESHCLRLNPTAAYDWPAQPPHRARLTVRLPQTPGSTTDQLFELTKQRDCAAITHAKFMHCSVCLTPPLARG